jgi:hypothetical protein
LNRSAAKKYHSYLHKYQETFYPAFAELDLMLKTYTKPLRVGEVARVLGIAKNEVHRFMRKNGYTSLTRECLLRLLEYGESELCGLYRREIAAGSPSVYTMSQVAYIYNLKMNEVVRVFNSLGIKEATPLTLPLVFSVIAVN